MTPDPLDRLPDALHRAVPASVRTRQREELLAAMAASSGKARASGLLPGSSWAFKRVRTVGLAAGLVLIPSAASAQSSAPGDLLYPLKQATEQVQVLFDDEAPARNRLEEVMTLLERDVPAADLSDALENAVDAVEEHGSADLEEHLEDVREAVIERRPDAVPDHAGAPGQPASPDKPGRPENPGEPGEEHRPEDAGPPSEVPVNDNGDDGDDDGRPDDVGRPDDAGQPEDRPGTADEPGRPEGVGDDEGDDEVDED